jgi:hypothetical protein
MPAWAGATAASAIMAAAAARTVFILLNIR